MGRGRGRAARREMRPIGLQRDVGVEAQADGWKKFRGIKGRIN